VVAGGKGEPPFDEKGYKIIFAYSKGLPRDAVKICDEVFRDLAFKEKKKPTSAEIKQLAMELNLKA
jgi:hypothetical protein